MKSPLDQTAAELIARRFKALSDPTRLLILDRLRADGESSVSELADAVLGTYSNTSRHLQALYAERFVSRRREGSRALYRLQDLSVPELCERVWTGLKAQHTALEKTLGSS